MDLSPKIRELILQHLSGDELLDLSQVSNNCYQKDGEPEALNSSLSLQELALTDAVEIPTIDLEVFLNRNKYSKEVLEKECKRAADGIRATGVLYLKDPRVSESHNNNFIEMLESFYDADDSIKGPCIRPDLSYQLGLTPSGVEEPLCKSDPQCHEMISSLLKDDLPQPIVGPDAKCRFNWRIGERPATSKFRELNAAPIIPSSFPNWKQGMDSWGSLMVDAGFTISRMLAIGFGMESEESLANLGEFGPHLLAPTGSNLGVTSLQKNGAVLAGFHSDLNFLTLHGKNRFPGLFIWVNNKTKVAVKVPEGCLLVQAGQQLEILTGGEVKAGYHEVIVTEDTLKAIEKSKAEQKSLWRVSSTLFFHIASDKELRPLPPFDKSSMASEYKPILAGDHVLSVLAKINLSHGRDASKAIAY